MTTKEIVDILRQDLASGITKIAVAEGHRYYTDTLTETVHVPITTTEETARLYKKLMIDKQAAQTAKNIDLFATLPRVSMFIGQPDTGKTYKAFQIAKDSNIDPLFIMCRDNLNLETLFEDFILEDGKPGFRESLAIKMMSGTERHIIILDEFNTLLTGVMKTLQPIFDDTSPTFEYRGKIYQKNMNCKFIVTLNEKDKGISIVPDAILSRSYLKTFEPTDINTLSKWTNVPVEWIGKLHKVYKALGLLSLFGTRQIKMLHGVQDIDVVRNHLSSLLTMKNLDAKIVNTLELKALINVL